MQLSDGFHLGVGTEMRSIATLEAAQQKAIELEHEFDLRWAADMRAIQAWRKPNPGKKLVLPDHADLCTWLIAKVHSMDSALSELRARAWANGDAETMRIIETAIVQERPHLFERQHDSPWCAKCDRSEQDSIHDREGPVLTAAFA